MGFVLMARPNLAGNPRGLPCRGEDFSRVDLGGCPPRSPTDPDLQDYPIRLLITRVRYGHLALHWILGGGSG